MLTTIKCARFLVPYYGICELATQLARIVRPLLLLLSQMSYLP